MRKEHSALGKCGLHKGQCRQKVLALAPFSIWPPHFGSSERIYNLSKQLAQDDRFDLALLYTDYAQVAVIGSDKENWLGATIIGVGPSRRWAQALNPWLILRGIGLILRERPDVILCEHLWASLHAIILRVLTGIPFILDDHNAEYVRLRRMGRGAARLVYLLEKLACYMAAHIVCVSEADKTHLVVLGVEAAKISVVHNAVDIEQYSPNPTMRYSVRQELALSEDIPIVLFFGKLDYQPNAEAVEIIVQDIMPHVLSQLPDTRFVICGYNPPLDRYRHPNLIFTGVVPRIEDYINAADVVIAPLISGGGTKFKIVQALACGRPVITTTVGSEGIEEVGLWMQVTDDWEQFAELVVECITHSITGSPDQLADFRDRYSWRHMTEHFAEIIEACVEDSRRS